MKKEGFVNKLAEFCEFDNEGLTVETPFKSIDNFDSLAIISIIAFVDEHFAVNLTAKDFKELTDFNSLITKIGNDKFEDD